MHRHVLKGVWWLYNHFNHSINYIRGAQREYSSKPLKHSIVKRILIFKRYPLKSFHLFGFPSWKSSDPKMIGIKTYLFENFSQKKAPENSRWPFQCKISVKNGQLYNFLDVRKSYKKQASKKFYKKCSENARSQIVFRTDIFLKLTLGAPAIYDEMKRSVWKELCNKLNFTSKTNCNSFEVTPIIRTAYITKKTETAHLCLSPFCLWVVSYPWVMGTDGTHR